MDTQRIAELIRNIETQENNLKGHRSTLAAAQAAITEQETILLNFKRELAVELSDILPGAKRKKLAPAHITGPRTRQTGISAAILATLADGQARSVADVTVALTEKGFTPKGVDMRLSALARAGQIRRTSRGMYARA
jgi:hypothetical protein